MNQNPTTPPAGIASFAEVAGEDTICALATPPGEGALALIRVSGPSSFKIAKTLAPALPSKLESHRIYFVKLLDPHTKEMLDEVLVLCFKQGRSFTGEESVELSCHGGGFVSTRVLKALTKSGARLAKPGEFSYRAFMNGKMDLIQAESVLSLIKSRSPLAQKQALGALQGLLSKQLHQVQQKLLRLLSHIEASIDFSDQDIQPWEEEQQKKQLKDIRDNIDHLIKGFQQGQVNRQGFRVLLSGAPNAGKSSLFNALLQEDKAIVTEQAGTTRDVLTSRLVWHGREFCLNDSAGFRENPDLIEQEGIKRATQEITKAHLCVFLVESHLPLKKEGFFGLEKLDPKKSLLLFSKADKLPLIEDKQKLLEQALCFLDQTRFLAEGLLGIKFLDHKQSDTKGSKGLASLASSKCFVSAKTGEGIEALKDVCFKRSETEKGHIFLSTPRQGMALKKLHQFLQQADKLLQTKASPDLIAFELKQGLYVLRTLLGQEYQEDIIHNIFKEFCLGK